MEQTPHGATQRLLRSRASFLILGDPEQARQCAAAAHRMSCEEEQPLVVLDCREPRVESALGQALRSEGPGTVVLLAVEALPRAAQDSLARALSSRGSSDVGWLRARIVASTSCDLFEEVRARRFRADLYFRLSTFTLAAPEGLRGADAGSI
jgi:DNA-binding NtrC family response regulator